MNDVLGIGTKMFAGPTEVCTHYHIASSAFLAPFVDHLLVLTHDAFRAFGVSGSPLIIDAVGRGVVTLVTGVKFLAASKINEAKANEMRATQTRALLE